MRHLLLPAAAAAVLLALPVAARASVVYYTASGSGSDGSLYAMAQFTIGTGQIDVTITNLLDPKTIVSIGQSVSDISFTLSNSPGSVGTSSASGQFANVAGGSGGAVTLVSSDTIKLSKTNSVTVTEPNRWIDSTIGGGITFPSGNTVTLEAIGHGSPTELILPKDAAGFYPKSNSSINVHSPNVDGPGTFNIGLSGVTDQTTITGVKFSFGTGPDTYLTGSVCPSCGEQIPPPPPLPEPASFAVLGVGLLGLAFTRRGRRAA